MARTLIPKENGRLTETANDYKFADFLFIRIQGCIFQSFINFSFPPFPLDYNVISAIINGGRSRHGAILGK